MARRLLRAALALGGIALITLLLFEVALRLVPSAIPTAMLAKFHPALRETIAETRGLRTRSAQAATSLERAEGGPAFGPYPPNQQAGAQADEVDKLHGASESVITDGRGFCNPPDTPLGETLVIGDSFVWCQNLAIDQTWSRHLGRALGGPVYNAGIPGIGLYEYNDILRWLLRDATPKRVIVSVYGGNDLRDAIRFVEWHERQERLRQAGSEDGAADTTDTRASTAPVDDVVPATCAGDPGIDLSARSGLGLAYYHLIESSWLGCVSYAVNTLGTAALQLRQGVKQADGPSNDFRYTITHRGEPVPFNIHSGDTNEIWHGRDLAEGRRDLSLWRPALEAFRALARERGFQPALIYIPSAFRVYPTEFATPEIGAAVNGLHETQARYLLDWGAETGVPVLDLTAGLRQAAAESEALLYFPANVHLTPAGGAVVGQLVADWMKAEGLAGTP